MNSDTRSAIHPASAGPPTARSATFSPLYQQIKGLITQGLESGQWKPGDMIPSEIELAGRFGVSQGTVRKAVDELAAEHLLVRRQGKGTFVASHTEPRTQFRFLRLTPNQGEPRYPESTILECKRARAPADVSRALELKAGEPVITIKRVLAFDGVPCVLDELWLPGGLFKGLTAERLTESKAPLYSLFESEFGTKMIRADEQVRAVAAAPADARLLRVAPGSPLLSVERLTYTYGDKPVEVRKGLYITRDYHYHNELI
ncbi:MAG: GntR family transcriptional regulator [Betaproteobacteria bacterium]|nr:GntR family transcriptional regulator [Betaproteobacteria bacterium]